MFGVLVVQNKFDEIGYLTAFSGKLGDNSLPEKFVPPVFNMRTEGSFYVKGETELDKIKAKDEAIIPRYNMPMIMFDDLFVIMIELPAIREYITNDSKT